MPILILITFYPRGQTLHQIQYSSTMVPITLPSVTFTSRGIGATAGDRGKRNSSSALPPPSLQPWGRIAASPVSFGDPFGEASNRKHLSQPLQRLSQAEADSLAALAAAAAATGGELAELQLGGVSDNFLRLPLAINNNNNFNNIKMWQRPLSRPIPPPWGTAARGPSSGPLLDLRASGGGLGAGDVAALAGGAACWNSLDDGALSPSKRHCLRKRVGSTGGGGRG